jgi:hypothetical protein
MTTPAVAPYVPTYATETPYLTLQEYLTAPTGVDTNQLVPGGDTAANAAALTQVIARASSMADDMCQQILAATIDTQAGIYRVYADGTIRVPVDYTPLIMVTGVSLGVRAGQLTALTDLSGLYLLRKVVRIPARDALGSPIVGVQFPAASVAAGEMFAEVTYVNGYTNTLLAAAVVAGDSSITVTSPLGIVPGLRLGIYDGANTEQITVDASYVIGSATLPLTDPLLYPHNPAAAPGAVAVSALPSTVKDAVIALTSYRIKTRGATAVAMGAMKASPESKQKSTPGASEDLALAKTLLRPFMRVR